MSRNVKFKKYVKKKNLEMLLHFFFLSWKENFMARTFVDENCSNTAKD